ncbi:hypothetical protein HDU98_005258 [Podochytrium sp. JEL0797]|nr:hypothetical protein HDU98_005258 [Podochytrium sp. JEL0797]
MAPRKKKLVPVTTFTRQGFSGIAALPTELFDEICGKYLRPVDVLTLGCVDKRLAFLTTRTSRIWTIFRDALGYPPIPVSLRDQISDKQVIVLLSKVGCAFCPAKTRNVKWCIMKRVCSKCPAKSRSASVTMASDSNFIEWTRQMDQAKLSGGSRKQQQAHLRKQRTAQLIERFAALRPVPIPINVLRECGGFYDALDVPALLTPRSFNKICRTISHQILMMRAIIDTRARFDVLRNLAMEGLPEQWKTEAGSHIGWNFEKRFNDESHLTLNNFAWNEEFPAFDPLPYLDEAKSLFHAPFEVYTECTTEALAEFPHLEDHLAETQRENEKWFFSHHGYMTPDRFLQKVQRQLERKRMLSLFPLNTWIGRAFYSGRIGAMEWLSRNVDVVGYKNYKNVQSDLEAVKRDAEEWQDLITRRIARVYRRIHEKSCKQVRSMKAVEDLDLLVSQQSPELALLADLPSHEVHNVHHHLRKITNVSSFEDRASFSGCRNALTAPDLFDEDEAVRLVAHEFNRSVSVSRMMSTGVNATSDIFVAFLSSSGMDFTREFDWVVERDPFFAWRKEFETRVNLVVKEGKMFESKLGVAVDLLVQDIARETAVLEDILPGKVQEFDVMKFVDSHEDWLKKWPSSKGTSSEYDSEDDDEYEYDILDSEYY